MIATVRQIEYATNLLKQLGYDVEEYNLDGMEVWEISKLISELKDELDGQRWNGLVTACCKLCKN